MAARRDYRPAIVNSLGSQVTRLHATRKLAHEKGVLSDAQAARLARAIHQLEDEIGAVVAEAGKVAAR